jgi:hypothetical protein
MLSGYGHSYDMSPTHYVLRPLSPFLALPSLAPTTAPLSTSTDSSNTRDSLDALPDCQPQQCDSKTCSCWISTMQKCCHDVACTLLAALAMCLACTG